MTEAEPRWRVALRQFTCGLHGHDRLPVFERKRIYLRCTSCDHETTGWNLDARPPRVRWDRFVRFRRRLQTVK